MTFVCPWFRIALTDLKEIDAYELTHASVHSSFKEVVFLGVFLAATAWRKLCLVNEASLIRIRTLINSPAELSGSSRRLTSLILPIQDRRTNGPGSPPRRCIHRQFLPAEDRRRERKMPSWENDGQAVYATDLHSQALLEVSETKCSKIYRKYTYVEKKVLYSIINCSNISTDTNISFDINRF